MTDKKDLFRAKAMAAMLEVQKEVEEFFKNLPSQIDVMINDDVEAYEDEALQELNFTNFIKVILIDDIDPDQEIRTERG